MSVQELDGYTGLDLIVVILYILTHYSFSLYFLFLAVFLTVCSLLL